MAAAIALAALAGVAVAAPEPVGEDFRISQVGGDADFEREAEFPAVAFNSGANNYLVVWYADALAKDGEYEVFGQLVSASGEEIGDDFRISTTGADGDAERDALRPAVAYNPAADEYLVVWEGDGLPTDNEFEIFGQRLSAAGEEQGTDFRISNVGPDTDADNIAINPAVAYNSVANDYLVVWHGSHLLSTEFDIWGQRVSAGGDQVPNSTDVRISNATAVAGRDAFDPAIAHDPTENQYLVTWRGDSFAGNDEEEIGGQLLDAAAAEISVDFRISEAGIDGDPSRSALSPELALGTVSGEYLVVWQEDEVVDGEFDVHGRRLSAAGAPQGEDFPIAEAAEAGLERDAVVPAISYSPLTNEFLVAFAGDLLGTDDEFEAFVQRLSAAGARLGPRFRVSSMGDDGDTKREAGNPDVAYNPAADEALAVWRGNGLPTENEREIFGRRLAEVPPSLPPSDVPGPVATCARKAATKTGTPGRDLIRGTRKRDVIAALGGNDTVRSLGGNDLVCGGNGRDKLFGGKGKDTLRGEAGGDKLWGEKGKDRLLGGSGRDLLRGGPARDALAGGPGRDKQRQ